MVHGREAARAVENLTKLLFSRETDFREFTEDEIVAFGEFLPVAPRGVDLVEALVQYGLAPSKKKAREFLAAGAISINGEKVKDTLVLKQTAIVKKGKNKFLVVK